MKQLLLLLCAISIVACKQEPKNYVTFSGKIINKNSDSIVLRTRTFSKTIHVNNDGTFKDTLKVEPGVYNLYDGTESTSVFLKNGFDINLNMDAKQFDESIKFSGIGAEDNNFLAEKALLEEKLLDQDKLSSLTSDGLNSEMDHIKTQLNEFYTSKTGIDSLLMQNATKDLEPMLHMYKNYFAGAIALREAFPKGTPSPIFENYENYKGGTTSLADLKGKYVYIDVWATWCGPCKAEIPYLKKVEEAYEGKNIQFVSISVDDERRTGGGSMDVAKEKWKAMIADKELGGIQLLSDNNWNSDFVKNYKINGIPRFILLDPDGNIVSADAPRPSSDKLIELFNELKI
ncbi:MAG: TlpA disulfide reductase family protein [Gelidibacter sp.]